MVKLREYLLYDMCWYSVSARGFLRWHVSDCSFYFSACDWGECEWVLICVVVGIC